MKKNKRMKKNQLILNRTVNASPVSNVERVVANFSGTCRYDEMEGRTYLVAPMVMLTEGVHAGSHGPVYYPPKEMAKTPAVWNAKPVVVYHPTMGGVGVSACDPVIFNTHKVGLIMNTRYDKKKKRLTAEAWLEPDRLEAIDPRVLEAIESDQPMELSTGLFTDNEDKDGTFKDKQYDTVATNFRPDHLALLPDKKGANSLADGAGFLVNENYTEHLKKRVASDINQIIDNAMSHGNVREALSSQLRERFSTSATGNDVPSGPWVEDVYDSFVVYDFGGELWQLSYTMNDTEVVLSTTEPEQVVRVTEYRTLTGIFVGNLFRSHSTSTEMEPDMKREETVKALVANDKSPFGEDDVEFLTNMKDDQFAKLVTVEEPVVINDARTVEEPDDNQLTVNDKDGQKQQTAAEYVNNAPSEIRDMLNAGLSSHNADRARVIANIEKAPGNTFTVNALESMDLKDLKAIEAIATNGRVPETQQTPARFQAPRGSKQTVTINDGDWTPEPFVAPIHNYEGSTSKD